MPIEFSFGFYMQHRFKFRTVLFGVALFAGLPSYAYPEIWEFNCTEAVNLLKKAQERVVQKHDQLEEAKFSLRYSPKEFDGCSQTRRGYHGGEIFCVKHESHQGHILRDVLVAQRGLDAATREFTKYAQGVLQHCPVVKP
jgi:hypothetical protein